MKPFEAIVSSTAIDAHGDMMTREALEKAAETFNKHILQMGVEHDPRHPPIGRFVEAWVEETPSGISVLKARGELFEAGDEMPRQVEKSLIQHEYTDGKASISFDRSYEGEEDIKDIREIADRFGTKPLFEAKKAVEPLSTLVIGAGAFVLGSIASGFFGSIGGDAYAWLKDKLKKLIENQKNKSKEQLLVFEYTVIHNGHQLLIQTIITNPSEADIVGFLSKAVYDLDAIHPGHFHEDHKLTRLVYFWRNGELSFQYAVRMDGYPVTFRLNSEHRDAAKPLPSSAPEVG